MLIKQPMTKNNLQNIFALSLVILSAACFNIPFFQSHIMSSNAAYDRVISQKWATYASLAFCPGTCLQAWSCGSGTKVPRLVNVTYIQNSVTKAAGYIGYDPSTQTLITSWRGSDNPQNWIQDFNFEMEEYFSCANCYIHAGFYNDYKLNEKKLLAAANAIIRFYKVSKILCTGHSLGAAISLINGIEFVHKFPNIPVQVHNFGQPRVGNQKLSEYMMSKISTIFRVVHNKDLVPHLPPEIDYHHPAYEVFFDENMTNYKVCSSSGEDKTCSNKYFPNYDTNDHDFYFIHISGAKC